MTAKIHIHIDRGGMPRSGVLNKKFDLFLDKNQIGSLGWGEKHTYSIPTGNHNLSLKYRHYDVYYNLDILAEEGKTVEIDSVMNMKKGGFIIFNKADGVTSARNYAGSSQTIEELMKSQKAAREEQVMAGCMIVGLFLSLAYNELSGFTLMGAIIGALIGTVAGNLLGMLINALRRKK
jgi:hypothetical protein